jgi:hypothetical protein
MYTNDSRNENFLRDMGGKWEYTNQTKLTWFRPGWEHENIGRTRAQIEEAVSEYEKLYDRGSIGPAPIIWFNPEIDFHEILDGFQRIKVVERKNLTTFPSYVLLTDSAALAQKIKIFANLRLQGGYQDPADWTMGNAVSRLVNEGLATCQEVADMGGWSVSTVRDKKAVMDLQMLVTSVGGPTKMAESTLRIIGKHSVDSDFNNAPVAIAGFCNDIQKMKLSTQAAEGHIAQFFGINRKKGKIFDQFSKKLKEFRADEEVSARLINPTRSRHRAMSAEGSMLRALKSALTSTIKVIEKEEPISDMPEFFQIWNKVKTNLHKIEKYSRRK